ncbi:MAG: tetratricopeptide repeat protein, partial [Chitinophagales bacterium]
MKDSTQELEEAKKWLKEASKLSKKENYLEAIEKLQKALPIFENLEDWVSYVYGLNGWCKCLWGKKEYEAALNKGNQALAISQERIGKQSAATAQSYYNLGLVYEHMIRYQDAIIYLKKSLDIRLKIFGTTHLNTAKSFHKLGQIYKETGEYLSAIEHYTEALQIRLQSVGELSIVVADSYNDLGVVYYNMGKYSQSIEYHTKSLQIKYKLLGEGNLRTVSSLKNLGVVYQQKGNYIKAIEYHDKSLQIELKKLGEKHSDTASSFSNLGIVYTLKGDYEKGTLYFKKALEIQLKTLGLLHPRTAGSYYNLGLAYQFKGEYEESLSYHNKSLEIRLQILGEKHPNTAASLNGLGTVCLDKLDYQSAIDYHTQSLQIRLQTLGEFHPDIGGSYLNLGNTYSNMGNQEKAIDYYNKSLQVQLKALGNLHPVTSEIYFNMGNAFHKQVQYKLALEAYQKGFHSVHTQFKNQNLYTYPTFEGCLSLPILLDLFKKKAQTFYLYYQNETTNSKDLLTAHHAHHLATKLISRLRHSYQSEGSKLTLSKQALEVYESAIQTALMLAEKYQEESTKIELQKNHQELQSLNPQHKLPIPQGAKELAFTYSEQSKAILLYSNLKNNQAKITAKIPTELLQKEYDLCIELNFLDNQIAQEQTKPKEVKNENRLLELQSQHFDYKRAYETLIQKFEKDYPKYYQLKYKTQTATIKEVQNHLQKQNTAFISYFVGKQDLTIFCITSNEYITHSIEKPDELEDWINDFQEAINMADLEDFVELGTKLYDTLLKPLEKQLKKTKQLIIIRDDVLHYLSFETLLTKKIETSSNYQFTDLPYLLLQYEVVYHYSATLLLHQSALPALVHETSFIGFAPITFDESEIISTELALESRKGRTVVLRSNRAGETALQSLPNTKNEVKNVYQLFENQKNSA